MQQILKIKLIILALALFSVTLPTATFSGQDSVKIFHQAPAPEVLANILFPPRYRSIDIDGAYNNSTKVTANSEQAGIFGMMINFEFDSADVLPESKVLLESLGEMMGLESVAGKSIVVEGHTDVVGSDAYNQALSEKRARAIKHFLVTHFGIAPKRLVTVGRGERDLFEKNNPKASVNRRAMFRPVQKVVLK